MNRIIARFEAKRADGDVRVVLRGDGRIQGAYRGKRFHTWAVVDPQTVTREQVAAWLGDLGFTAVEPVETFMKIR